MEPSSADLPLLQRPENLPGSHSLGMKRSTYLMALTLVACSGNVTPLLGVTIQPPKLPGADGLPSVGAGPTPAGTVPKAPPASLPPLAKTAVDEPMRRLSGVQYQTVLEDLVARSLPLTGAETIASLPRMLESALYPVDALKNPVGNGHGGFRRVDQSLQQAHVDGSYAVALALSAQMTATSARMTELVGSCATDGDASNDKACLESFVGRFGRVAFRRPLSMSEVSLFVDVGSVSLTPAAVARIIGLMLCAPEFLYVVELGGPAPPMASRIALTAHELATRLSLHFWNTLPDNELSTAADNQSLLDESQYQAQVARLARDQRAERTLREFFSQWFELERTPSLDSRLSDPVYRSVAGTFVPTAQTKQHVVDEIDDLVTYLYRQGRPVSDVLTDGHAVSRTADVAELYGVAPWDGSSTPASLQNRNLITRLAFLASGVSNTRPILKGARIRSQLLCQPLPPPPPEAMNVTVEFSPTLTTRDAVEKLTEQNGTSCASCHKTLVNPLGFITENFDAFGRVREAQQLFDSSGAPSLLKPVNTSVVLGIPTAGAGTVKDANEGVKVLADTGLFEWCFARQYFRFAFGRKEQEFDQYVVDQLQFAARTGQPLAQVVAAVALRPEFRMRISQ